MATATYVQERTEIGSAYIAVDAITSASPSTLGSIFVILRTGQVGTPIEILLRIATIQDLNVLGLNPLTRLSSNAWPRIFGGFASGLPASMVFNTLPDTWQTKFNTTRFSDLNLTSYDLGQITDASFIRITGGYGSYTSGTPLILPLLPALSGTGIIPLPAGYYFPLGPSTQNVSYSIGAPLDNYSAVTGMTTGQITYNNIFNIKPSYTYAAGDAIPLDPAGPPFPAAMLSLAQSGVTTNTDALTLAQSLSNPLLLNPSAAVFLTSNPAVTNISLYSSQNGAGSLITWTDGFGNTLNAITDGVMVRSDSGASTIFLDSQFYSFYSSANNALAHSTAVVAQIESLLAQESANLLPGGGSLLGISTQTLSPLP